MVNLLNLIGQHEINIGRYYLERGAYIAALNRSKYVIERYPEIAAIEDALGIMIQVYTVLGLSALRDDTISILEKNYPKSTHNPKVIR